MHEDMSLYGNLLLTSSHWHVYFISMLYRRTMMEVATVVIGSFDSTTAGWCTARQRSPFGAHEFMGHAVGPEQDPVLERLSG
jgi:hypothetical protein